MQVTKEQYEADHNEALKVNANPWLVQAVIVMNWLLSLNSAERIELKRNLIQCVKAV